jgi:hypothetical protein
LNVSEEKSSVKSVFVGLMSVATVHRAGEVVAATAGYPAVLTVLIQVDGKEHKS